MAISRFSRVTAALAAAATASLLAACDTAPPRPERPAAANVAAAARIIARGWQSPGDPAAAARGAGARQAAHSLTPVAPSVPRRDGGFEVSTLPPATAQADRLAANPAPAGIETADAMTASVPH